MGNQSKSEGQFPPSKSHTYLGTIDFPLRAATVTSCQVN